MTGRILGLLGREPVRVAQFAAAVGALLAFLGVDKTLLGLLGGVLLAALELVRRLVTPVGTAAQAVVDGAVAAASQAVARVDATAAGEVGELTSDGLIAVSGAVEDAVAVVLDQTGLNPKGRKVQITEGSAK